MACDDAVRGVSASRGAERRRRARARAKREYPRATEGSEKTSAAGKYLPSAPKGARDSFEPRSGATTASIILRAKRENWRRKQGSFERAEGRARLSRAEEWSDDGEHPSLERSEHTSAVGREFPARTFDSSSFERSEHPMSQAPIPSADIPEAVVETRLLQRRQGLPRAPRGRHFRTARIIPSRASPIAQPADRFPSRVRS